MCEKRMVATWNGHDWDAVVTARQGVDRVDVSIAGGTERGSIRLAKKGCRGTLTGLTNTNAFMARSHHICCMYVDVIVLTQIGGICLAVYGTCSGMATVTHPSPVVVAAIKTPTVLLFQH